MDLNIKITKNMIARIFWIKITRSLLGRKTWEVNIR